MPEGKLLGYVVVYLPENRIYPDTSYDEEGAVRIVNLLTLEQAETLAVKCRDAWENCDRDDTQVVAIYGLPYEAPTGGAE